MYRDKSRVLLLLLPDAAAATLPRLLCTGLKISVMTSSPNAAGTACTRTLLGLPLEDGSARLLRVDVAGEVC
jgi:hypothetical protein